MNKKIKILYLADNAADVHLVEQVLRKSKYNFTIKPVNNKIDFTNSLKNEPCDLIFADSNLAGFKGMQALNHSKKLKPKIPFILITDVLDDKTLVNFIDEGVWDYVFKDKLLRLISTVANALKIKKKEESLISALVKIVEIMKEYRFLHENVTDMLLSYDDSTKRILKCNKTFLKTTGYSEAEIYNTLFSKLIPRLEFQTTLVGYFKTLKKSGISDDYSTRLIKKDNTKMYCSLMSKVNEDNTVDVVLRDYSHTKKHENERLKFLEVFDKGIYEKYIINSYSLKMEYANKTALAKLGYSFSEIKNITFADIQPEYSVSEIFDIVQKLEENEELPLKYFTTQKSKSGETYPVEVVLQKTKRGGYNIILAFVTDITNTIYNEKIMTQLETVAAQSPVSIVITDKEGAIEYINPAFSKITGYSFEDVVGKNPNILQSGTHTAEYYKEMWDTVLRGEVWKGQFRNKKKTGEIFWEESAISAIKNKSGDITGIVAVKNDITKRKRINEKLRRSEAHYRQYFENSVLGLYVSDMDGVLIRANESLYTLLGYQTLEEMRESSYLNTNQYNFYRREFMAELLKNGTVSSYEWVWLDKSGKQIFLRENAGIFLNAEGQKIIEGNVENITEQKKAKAAIVELNELNQNFIKFGELGYAVFSLKGECKYANENYAKIVNQSLSEIKKTNLSHSIFWKENEMQKHLNDIITNGQAIKKAIEVKRNDKTLWIDMVIKRLKYKGKLRLVVVIKDISFAIQANRKQLELKADFNRLTEYITMPVFGIKKNGKISQWNEIMAVISGKSKEDSIGKQAKDVFPENEFDQIIKEMFETQEVSYFNTELVLNVNTNKVYSEKLLVTIMPFRKEGEQLTELIAFGQDITKREKYKYQLEKEVELRTEELEEALLEQKQLGDLRSKFVSTASHEFRTPLSVISFTAEFIKKYSKRMSDDKKNEKLDKIGTQVKHMTRLLDDVLVFGKTQNGKMKVSISSFDILAFLKEIILEVEEATKNSERVILKAQDKECNIESDKTLVKNIVSNLLTNALKFSPPEEKVYVGLSIEKSAIKVVVKDNGIGIPESNISHIFSPFYRADNAEMIQGTGLGLPIVKESIEKLNGKIEIDSALNKGTEISVILPQN